MSNSTADHAWLEGAISIEAALQSGSRELLNLFVLRGKQDRRIQRIGRLARNAGVEVKRVPEAFIQERSEGKSHGGLIAQVGPRRFASLGELVEGKSNPFVVMLDGIEDPFNFGQAIRALYAAGADGLVVRNRSWLSAASVVARSSAGASERILAAQAETAAAAAAFYASHGLVIACATNKRSVSLYEADLTGSIFLLVGGEKRGITRSFLEQASLRLRIPYQRDYPYSLGAASSAAIIAFEIMRQRHRH
jgi:23S rRNA (guanosine2251-2'-O)-methyltransferase